MLLNALHESKILSPSHRQTPQCEGHHVDRIVFDAQVPGRRTVYEVKRNKRGRLVIDAGLIHGVVTGTRFSVYADRNFEPGSSPTVTMKVVEVSAFTSKL